MRQRAVTILDVAREAGVSYATVSRVVNNKRSILPDKRARVQAAMQRLGYVPNMQARKLAGGRSQVVGLVLHDVWSSYVLEILRGVDEELAAAEYDLMLYTSRRRTVSESAHVTTISQGMADGLLLLLPRGLNEYILTLRQRHFPVVLIDHPGPVTLGPAVSSTNRQGASDAMRHLIALGHRRIGFITGAMDVGAAIARLDGYRDALEAHAIPFDADLVAEGDFWHVRARVAARQLLGLENRPTAIFASNDVTALEVLQVARELELRVPEDLSVVGFDDIPQATYAQPALTTVRQSLEQMGRAAARLLLATLRDPNRPPECIELPTELIVRGSTARCAQDPASAKR